MQGTAHLRWCSGQHGGPRTRVGKIFRLVSAVQQGGGGELWAATGRGGVNDERRDWGWGGSARQNSNPEIEATTPTRGSQR
jgi:hypothetical protein